MKFFSLPAQLLRCDCRDNGGINAAGEKRADGNVGDHLSADGVAYENADLFHRVMIGIGVRNAG